MKVMLKFLLFLSLGFSCEVNGFFLGAGIHPNNMDVSPQKYKRLLDGFGFNSFRTDYHWSNIERKKYVYKVPTSNDEVTINYLGDVGVKPIIILGYSNPNYTDGKPVLKTQVDGFCNFAAWTVNHFHKVNAIYEIWNEWSIDKKNMINSHSLYSAQKYYDLVKDCSIKMRGIDPDVKIIAGSFNPNRSDDFEWGVMLFKLGIDKYISGVSIHQYDFSSPSGLNASKDINSLVSFDRKISQIIGNGNTYPMYITEVGVPTYKKLDYSPADVGRYANEYISLAKQNGFIKGVWWYDLINDGTSFINGEDNFGLLYHNLKGKVDPINFKLN